MPKELIAIESENLHYAVASIQNQTGLKKDQITVFSEKNLPIENSLVFILATNSRDKIETLGIPGFLLKEDNPEKSDARLISNKVRLACVELISKALVIRFAKDISNGKQVMSEEYAISFDGSSSSVISINSSLCEKDKVEC